MAAPQCCLCTKFAHTSRPKSLLNRKVPDLSDGALGGALSQLGAADWWVWAVALGVHLDLGIKPGREGRWHCDRQECWRPFGAKCKELQASGEPARVHTRGRQGEELAADELAALAEQGKGRPAAKQAKHTGERLVHAARPGDRPEPTCCGHAVAAN